MSAAIELDNVVATYRNGLFGGGSKIQALNGISLELRSGEVFAFLGPNGAGKTTTINILMGFLFPDSGTVRVMGYPPGDVRAKRQIGFLPENFAFYGYLTGEQLLRFHIRLAGPQKLPGDAVIPEMLAKVKLDGYPGLKIGKFSRGMVQRIGLAQALMHDPQLIILDEPTSGLDPVGRKEVRELILSLKAQGKTVFLSSHILSEVEQVCDRIAIVEKGSLKQMGAVKDLLNQASLIEIVVDQLPPELEADLIAQGATVTRLENCVKLTIPSEQKREVLERLWTAGCDLISLNSRKSSLEDLFLQLVGEGHPE